MPRVRLTALILAVAAVFAWSAPAHANVIDFDPSKDPKVPEILSPEELALYGRIRSIARPAVSSQISPDGQYVLASVGGRLQVFDIEAKTLKPIDMKGLATLSPWKWAGAGEAVVLARGPSNQLTKVLLTASTQAIVTSTFTVGTIPGKSVMACGIQGCAGQLVQKGDGTWHDLAYTATSGRPPLVLEARPTYQADPDQADTGQAVQDPGNLDDPGNLGTRAAPSLMLQSPEQVALVSIDTGAITIVGDLPAGTNLGETLNSLSIRPGTNTASYLTGYSPPWSGKVIGGRGNRGGGMPTSYWNTQENLGLIPEAQNLWLTRRALHIVDMDTGQEKVIQNSSMPMGMFADTFWTADGSLLAVVTDVPAVMAGRKNPVYEYASGRKLRLFGPDGSFLRDWSDPRMDMLSTGIEPATGTKVRVITPANLTRHAFFVDLANPATPPVGVYTGDRNLFSNAFDENSFVGVLGDATDPGDLYAAEADNVGGTLARVTDLNATVRAAANLKFEVIKYRTSHGVEVEGAYIYPAGWSFPPAKPGPVVVWQAGGPGGQILNTWGTSVESPYTMLPAFGIPVFLVNGSGRDSNGAKYYTDMADGTNFGQRDISDVKEGVDQLIELGVADPMKVGVTGCSYGGYFTLQSMVEFPDFYHAGNAQCSLNDLLYEYNLGWSPFLAYLVGSSTTANPEEYIKDSPQFNSSKIKHPLLLFDGTDDFLPFEEITNIHAQVEANGVPASYFRARGYGHGFGPAKGDPSGALAQRYAAQLQISWFRQHLGIQPTQLTAQAAWRRIFPELPIAPIAPMTPHNPFGPEVSR